MSNIPNIITSARLLAAAILLLLIVLRADHGADYFLLLFAIAGVSDMLDGFIARRFNWCTECGAKLDSISDLMLYIAVTIFLFTACPADLSKCGWCILLGAAVQGFHCLLALLKLKQYPAYHTIFSRVCAYAMFFGVIAFWQTRLSGIVFFLVSAWVASSCEGIIITSVLKKPMTNIDGIFSALAAR